jgi:hypothetical protein
MKIKKYVFSTTLVFCTTINVFSQLEKPIAGKIVCLEMIPQGIKILNLVSEKETVSDIEGKFVIMAKPDDLLVFSSNNFDYMRKMIDDDDYRKGAITVAVTPKINQLEEVQINTYPNLNAVSLGILDKPAKTYTPAQRKLRTASNMYPSFGVGTIMGFSMGLDPVINAISGRTKMLKKYVISEKAQLQVEKISNMFSDDYFIHQLKIKENLVRGFIFFAVENQKVIDALSMKNKFLVSFALIKVAEDFNKLQDESNEN